MSFMQVEDLKVHYPIRGGFFNTVVDHVYAVDGVTMEFDRGKTYGLVGESGSGKSTTGKAIIGLEKITSGRILYEGEDVTNARRKRDSAYNRDIQMIFQDSHSSMNPRKRVLDILAEPIRNFLKLSPQEERKRINELLAIVGMSEDVLLKYPHEFSGGQKQRLGIARAVACNPKMIIADEPVSALDLSVQAQVLNFMKDIQEQYGISYLFISHDLGVVRHMCDHISIMYKGRFVETGKREDIYTNPQHIYTNRLLSAIPDIEPETRIERKLERQQVEAAYRQEQHKYYDKDGKVYPLKSISDSHRVAMSEDEKERV
ncbi:peptide/nickel transport system ATP-binding protein [Solibacillus kalamii]|uniref:ABC-type oligopeptide transport system, ATPase component n=3 Tax=Solibacillus TaxID=648800 RepID=F2F685_SOLSS|nr:MULTISPECIES: ATP-binding cassette domain-containing protein [Solibacillus]AMO84622.1 peptide ABC transporter substrate-binding protein [Solibacillus silvestris]EKB46940.1 Glutathione import ATP-binding protein GsiA [Solibacillus isronensis B3W22]MBM7665096.1 peptide/nickel transport system ATP-binding protein [Solibacillus kalamii]OBW58591.1 peptide ABC transporter substrate-binding protein [Solibacillus silvestris]OUZ40543.1 ABC transporter ATP-binding protein [Solibacillus kalamii]